MVMKSSDFLERKPVVSVDACKNYEMIDLIIYVRLIEIQMAIFRKFLVALSRN